MSLLKWLLSNQIKHSRLIQRVSGFTLIELLVAMVLAVLILTPLLGFMINILDTDRKEQAKTNSEQEIQNALDFIARDLQQAVYIYDTDGLSKTSLPTNPTQSGIKNQIPPMSEQTAGKSTVGCSDSTQCQPVLVFWKRKFLRDVIEVSGASGTDKADDTFVYSLVAYYIIKDSNTTWSKAARIARFEVSDGVQNTKGEACTGYPDEKYLKKADGTKLCPQSGFKQFNLSDIPGSLKDKMNTWTKLSTANYDQPLTVLVDYVDQTPMSSPQPTCPSGKLVSSSFMGFYTCVNSTNNTLEAQVFLRGNALARLQNKDLEYSDKKRSYFPTASIRVEGRGYLFTK